MHLIAEVYSTMCLTLSEDKCASFLQVAKVEELMYSFKHGSCSLSTKVERAWHLH